jgi:hypothetical protein
MAAPAPVRRPRKREAQLAFEALSIEGGLLSPDWLARAAQLAAPGQNEADYRVPKGLNLRDEIGRYWRIGQAHWAELAAGRAASADPGKLAERFVQGLLRDAFGFATLAAAEPIVISERRYPIGFAALGARVPVVIAPAGSGLDTPSSVFGDGSRRRNAFGLAQEYLNAAEGALWGLVSDGVTLRILRDNSSLTRPAWIEADLGRIFTEERYADFAALWLLAHESRFGRPDQPVAECALEVWRDAGREQGTRAREHLRDGFQEALAALGQGFLAQSDNGALRQALGDGSLTTKDYFNQLLRLVYRLIFLITVEERGLLHPNGGPEAHALYAEGYGLRRLRERSVRRSAHDRFSDLWEATKIVFRGLATGEPRLALPALAGIFATSQCPHLDAARLENRALLLAVFRLSWLRDEAGLERVNWRDMGPEELGSVYESLLELVPQIRQDGRQFTFAVGGETKGNARKTTGSYYTPDSLVQVLLDSALEPVVASTIAANPDHSVEALLQLAIVDPACGSGHFLLAAARRLAAHVARLQAGGTPSAAEYRHALRQVIGHCIFGVDLNPMAVELCRVNLWMEAVDPGLPLTFLKSHVREGNALLGTTPGLLAKGIPDAAWDAIEEDDKKTAIALKKRNKVERNTQNLSFEFSPVAEGASIAILSHVRALDAAPDRDAAEVERKETTWRELLASAEFRSRRLAADAWCAAFVWPKQVGELASNAPTHGVWERLRHAPETASPRLIEEVERLAHDYRFFHWHLAFPQVFARGGFDVVLGNPPWDRITFQEREWFAERSPEIALASTAGRRRVLIAALEKSDPALHGKYIAGRRNTSAAAAFCSNSEKFALTAVGHFNTYALFTELAMSTLVNPTGRAAVLAPTAVVTGDYSKALTRTLVDSRRLLAVFDFDNRAKFFPSMQPNVRFAVVVLTGSAGVKGDAPTLVASQLRSISELTPNRISRLQPSDVLAINPETATIPFFYSGRDAAIVASMYRVRPSLFDRSGDSSWSVDFGRMLNMSDDSDGFVTLEELPSDKKARARLLPVYEAKLTGQFDHRAGTFEGIPREDRFRLHAATNEPTHNQKDSSLYSVLPRYWLPEDEVSSAMGNESFFLAFRDAISATADARSLAASFVPRTPIVNTLFLVRTEAASDAMIFAAAMNSFVLDYVLRQKATGAHASCFIIRQLPFPRRQEFDDCPSWDRSVALRAWIASRVLELSYTAWDLEAFAHDAGYDGPPFRWDPERRFLLRSELDAAFFHVYGISRDDINYVMDTFPIVRRTEEKSDGEFRSKRVILEAYDAMAEASRTNAAYVTRLDPPPADPRVAHSDTRKGAKT